MKRIWIGLKRWWWKQKKLECYEVDENLVIYLLGIENNNRRSSQCLLFGILPLYVMTLVDTMLTLHVFLFSHCDYLILLMLQFFGIVMNVSCFQAEAQHVFQRYLQRVLRVHRDATSACYVSSVGLPRLCCCSWRASQEQWDFGMVNLSTQLTNQTWQHYWYR